MEMDFGHTDPKWILPMGGIIEVERDPKGIVLIESPWL
jgi:muramoyltetrapeptide carboxypeptidase LdcA involved in peptidoglycan recycling